jgi:hypothetical protein
MGVTVLDRELYDEALAARPLRVPPSTLHWWLEGGVVSPSAATGSETIAGGDLG